MQVSIQVLAASCAGAYAESQAFSNDHFVGSVAVAGVLGHLGGRGRVGLLFISMGTHDGGARGRLLTDLLLAGKQEARAGVQLQVALRNVFGAYPPDYQHQDAAAMAVENSLAINLSK